MGRTRVDKTTGRLPREADLAEETGASRAALRASVQLRTTPGVLRVEQDRGGSADPATASKCRDLLATPTPNRLNPPCVEGRDSDYHVCRLDKEYP